MQRQSTQLTRTDAQALTDRIDALLRDAVDGLDQASVLMLEAKEQEAWRALGYRSWSAYVEERHEIGRQFSYRLLDQGRVIRALSEVAGEPVPVTEREARDVAKNIPEVVARGRQIIEQGEQPSAAMRAALAEQRQAVPKKHKNRGMAVPTTPLDRLQAILAELQTYAEQLEGDVLDYIEPYDRGQLSRVFSRIADAALAMAQRLDANPRQSRAEPEDW